MKIWSTLHRRSRPLHRWLTMLIGLQIVIWTLSGLVMSFFPIEKVRSEHRYVEIEAKELDLKAFPQDLAVAQKVLKRLIGSPVSVEFFHLLETPVMRVDFADGSSKLVSTQSGEILTPLNRAWATRIAQAHYKGKEPLLSVKKLKVTNGEYKKTVPVWRADFENEEETTFYISRESGEVVARRSKLWRFHDFFWMLHIMDYWNRTNFNSWWLVAAAGLGVLATTSGLILTATHLKRKLFKN